MVRGNPASIRGLVDDNSRAVVQLDQAKMGVSSYSVRVVPDRLRQLLVDQNPTVSIELEPIETREVTVSVETSGKLSDNRYVLEDILSSPSKVEVRGPKSQIKDATRVMAVIDLTSVEPNRAIPYTVNVQIQNAAGANIEYALATPSTVSITPTFAPAPIEFPAFVSLDLKSVKAADGGGVWVPGTGTGTSAWPGTGAPACLGTGAAFPVGDGDFASPGATGGGVVAVPSDGEGGAWAAKASAPGGGVWVGSASPS
jgi:hypothetical protein